MAILERLDWLAPRARSRTFDEIGVGYGFEDRSGGAPQVNHCRQVHGTRVVEAAAGVTNPEATARVEADALYTKKSGEVVGVRTADCLPVLFTNRQRTAAMATHAGWRGLTAGILGDSVDKLAELGERGDIAALIGPTIGREHFQVGPEVVEALVNGAIGLTEAQAGLVISKDAGDRWFIDLRVAAALAVVNAGVPPERVGVLTDCTWSDKRYFSYRREGAGSGSNWSWIRL